MRDVMRSLRTFGTDRFNFSNRISGALRYLQHESESVSSLQRKNRSAS